MDYRTEEQMKVLAKQISNLLFEHDCVIVPGLGGFIANYKPASIHPHHHTFHPPSKQITFNAALNGNDGILANALALSMCLEFNEAARIIEHEVHNLRILLLKGRKIELEDIGYLVANKENNIEFYPSGKINYLGEAYGLTRFDFNPVNRVSDVPIAGIDRRVVRKTMRWAAILLPVAAVALWTTLNTGTLDRIVGNYASLIPSTESTHTAPGIKNHISTFNASDVTAGLIKAEEQVGTAIEWGKVSDALSVTESGEESASFKPIDIDADAAINTNAAINTGAENTNDTMNTGVENTNGAMNTSTAMNSIALNNGDSFYIIAGAFSVPENAAKLIEQLRADGHNAQLIGQNRRKLHMVSISSFSNKKEASASLAYLHRNGFPSAWLLGQ